MILSVNSYLVRFGQKLIIIAFAVSFFSFITNSYAAPIVTVDFEGVVERGTSRSDAVQVGDLLSGFFQIDLSTLPGGASTPTLARYFEAVVDANYSIGSVDFRISDNQSDSAPNGPGGVDVVNNQARRDIFRDGFDVRVLADTNDFIVTQESVILFILNLETPIPPVLIDSLDLFDLFQSIPLLEDLTTNRFSQSLFTNIGADSIQGRFTQFELRSDRPAPIPAPTSLMLLLSGLISLLWLKYLRGSKHY